MSWEGGWPGRGDGDPAPATERGRCEDAAPRWLDGTLDEARRACVVGAPDEAAGWIAEGAADLPRLDRRILIPSGYERERRDRLAGSVAPRLRDRFSPTPGR